MATINSTVISQAVDTLVNQPTKRVRVVNGGRSTKNQGNPVKVTWETATQKIITAVGIEGKAHNQWVSVSDHLWVLGVRPADLEDVTDAKGKKVRSEMWQKIEPIVIKGFSPRVQSLLSINGAGLSGLNEAERGERRYWNNRIPVMMSRIVAYLKKHEDNERGKSTTKTLSQQIETVCVFWIKKIKDAKAEKIDGFDDQRVVELFQEIRKEVI